MIINFYEIKIPFDKFQISRIPYSTEKLRKLRERYNEYCSFFRRGDYIYISPMKNSPFDLPDPITLSINDNEEVVESLIKHIFFRTFRERYTKYLPTSFYPFSITSSKQEINELDNYLTSDLKNKISFKKSLVVNLRKIEFDNKKKYGFVISTKYKWIFNKNLTELINEGYDVLSKPVIEALPIPGLEKVLAPDEELIGTVKDITGNDAIINTNIGEENHDLNFLYLQKSKSIIGDYLNFRLGEETTNKIFNTIKSYNEIRFKPSKIINDTNEIAGLLSKLKYENLDSFCFTVNDKVLIVKNSFPTEETSFIYDYTPGYSSKGVLSGLIKFGPYDSSNFDKKNLNILVICSNKNRGAVSSFLAKLKDGIPTSKFFKNGLVDLFRLHTVKFDIKDVATPSPDSYKEIIKISLKENQNKPYDLAIVEGSERSKKLDVENNPYYHAKLILLSLGIPVQAVKDSTFRFNDRELGNILGPLSLQIYAKLGGIPWVLPTAKNIDREIIIGVGSSLIRKNLFSEPEQSKVVGITTIFSGDGQYLLGKQLKDVEYENYFSELLISLKNSIENLSKEYGWSENDNIRIVFHIFKPIKNIEADVVKQLISSYTQYRIQHAFVTISEKHPFFLLDENYNHTLYDVPLRGSNFLLDDKNCLLQIRGRKELKTSFHKFSDPILIKIHKDSSFTDINYIAQQILNFTHMSWRSFNPSRQPVTIFYSDLIAELTSKLKKLGFSTEIIDHHFKDKKWFL